jgi:hypothetical protein
MVLKLATFVRHTAARIALGSKWDLQARPRTSIARRWSRSSAVVHIVAVSCPNAAGARLTSVNIADW